MSTNDSTTDSIKHSTAASEQPRYLITSRGTNQQGNIWESRVSESGAHGYHYDNMNGSSYDHNFDGSRYYNNGRGYARYISPEGKVMESFGK